MKSVLRWIMVLPGAVAAMLLVNAINGLIIGFLFHDTIEEICKAWFGTIAFILAAYYITPKGKDVTTIIITTAYCVLSIVSVFLTLEDPESAYPKWLLILDLLITVLAAVCGCAIACSLERQKRNED